MSDSNIRLGHSANGTAITEEMVEMWAAEAEKGFEGVSLVRGGPVLVKSNETCCFHLMGCRLVGSLMAALDGGFGALGLRRNRSGLAL